MPHVIVKLWPGKTEEQKRRLASAIADDVMRHLGYGAESVSVAIDEVEPGDWAAAVYGPELARRPERLYVKPGYTLGDL